MTSMHQVMEKKVRNRRKTTNSDIQQNGNDPEKYVQTYKGDAIKDKLIKSLQFHLGNIKKSCADTGINRSTYYEWYNNDPFFRQQVDDIHEGVIDFVESELHNQISEGNITAIIFFLKTKGKKRGYVERTELDVTQQNVPDLSNLSSDEIINILKLSEGGVE